MKNYKKVILTGCSVIFSIMLFAVSVCYAQQPDLKLNHSTGDFKQDSTKKNKSGIILSMGAGPSIIESAFIVSPGITGEFHKFINLTTSVDFYFTPKYESNFYVINIVPYFVIRPSGRTVIQLGIGGQVYKGRIAPLLATKFDFEVFPNNYLGVEIKTFFTEIMEKRPYLLLLLTYSIRL